MARGFESKSVADQQEASQTSPTRGDMMPAAQKRLALARADVQQRLRTATHSAHREMLARALHAIDEQAGLDKQAR